MTQQEQVKTNYTAFKKMLDKIIVEHRGQFALMHDGEIISYFDTSKDAFTAGQLLYGCIYEQGRYSVQEVTDKVINLGWFSL
jgi:hypothetical protein